MRRVCVVLAFLIGVCVAAVPGEPMIDDVPLTQVTADLESGDPQRQAKALSLVKEAGPEAASVIPAVTRLLDAPSPDLRKQSALTLSMLGEASAPVLAKLRKVIANDPDEKVREMAWFAHASLAGPESTPAIGGTAGSERLFAEPPPPTEGQAAFDSIFGQTQRYSQETTWPQANADVTDFLQPLRNHHAKLSAIKARLEAMAPRRPDDDQARQWTQDLQSAGQDLITESRAFRTTLNQFITSPKRRGLTEEFDLIQECFEATDGAAMAVSTRSNFDVQGYALDRNLRQQAAGMRNKVVAILAEEVDHRLEAEGFFVLLATEGIASVKNEAVARLRTDVEDSIDEITERELGIPFHDERSFSSAVQHKLRSLVRGKIHQLLFKITSNEIIVEILGAPIIRWLETDLWPKLKEAFRNKGDLQFRTERSMASLIRAKDRLWALPPDATLDTVQAARRNAAGAMNATRYLVGDLQRANRTDLYQQLKWAAEDLAWVIDTTAHRFLLDKAGEIEKLEADEETYRALIAMVDAMVRDIEMPTQVAEGWGQQVGGESGGAGFMRWLQPVEDPELAERISRGMGANDRGGDEPGNDPLLERIIGTYDGRNELPVNDTIVVVLSGTPDGQLSWKMTQTSRTEGLRTRSGVMSNTGETWEGYLIFGGNFDVQGLDDPGWAEIKIPANEDSQRGLLLDIWNHGRPSSQRGAWRIYLKKQQ